MALVEKHPLGCTDPGRGRGERGPAREQPLPPGPAPPRLGVVRSHLKATDDDGG